MKKPLTGKTVVVTRAAEQAQELIAALNCAGAEVIHIPTIEFIEPDSWQACDEAIENLFDYDWIVFTSTNGARFFLQRLDERKKSVADLNARRIAAVGERTEVELRRFGVRVTFVPEEFNAEGLVQSFHDLNMSGKNVLIPKAQGGRDILEKGLRAYGANVDVVTVYKIQAPKVENPTEKMYGKQIDLLTFTSPSTFKNFLAVFGKEKLAVCKRNGCAVAAIGTVTADAIAKHDFSVDILAQKSTVAEFVEAISEYFSEPAITE